MRYIKKLLLTTLLFSFASISTVAMAHKVNLFAYAEADQVYVEGYFVDGKKAQNSQVQVYSSEGKLLVEGVTDDEGQYRFPVTEKTDLKIVLNAGMGHQSEFILTADELGGLEISAQEQPAHPQSGVDRTEMEDSAANVNVSTELNNQQLEAVVSKAVNEAIKPLVRELSSSQEKASLSGIVGGVGYILGILGLFAFFKARQNK